VELFRGHRETGAIVKVREIETDRTVVLQVDDVLENLLRIGRLAVWREAHEFVLAFVDLEAGVIGKRRIQEADRMREM